MNTLLLRRCLLLPLLTLATPSLAQIHTVPMKGLGNEWVKQLELRGDLDWEWIETYPTQVYFASRQDALRKGDQVTMWLRVEYRDPQKPGPHRSILSRDDWDCKTRRRSTQGVVFYKWSNLQADEPFRSSNLLRYWEAVTPGTVGETLLQFACSIDLTQPVVPVTPIPSAPRANKGS